ncbi:methionyl-tRNA formyltransferase [Maribacter vaceletii]|uniref:Methionyl-tRNA formyltransferase n=1 Tax=Maribacter vaceletii TaxID=1206816 RepID=A0A495E7C1_9FLAO|nr:methionyl-tRNA formyltransferase [Maribacter vaceletii]RKR12838.1 methionyl-tRNA formyltransferase [Maribacter vaceletii]
MKDIRILFMGTPDFAVATLSAIVTSKYNVVGVITAPDRPAGRGRKLNTSAVKKYALEQNIPILQPTNLKDSSFLEELKKLHANLQIVVAFRMLPKVVWQMPEYGTFNLHASLLPSYRGAAPINWAIINGETKTGVTTFFIDDKIDTGEIILQEETTITQEDTAGTLHDKLMDIGAALVIKTITAISNNTVTLQKQKESKELKSAYKIHKETCKVDWQLPLHAIYNHIRGLCPYPAAWTTLYTNEEEVFLKIYAISKTEEVHTYKFGKLIFNKKEIKVAVKNGFINLLEIQLPGKRKMKTNDVLNGLKLEENAHVA